MAERVIALDAVKKNFKRFEALRGVSLEMERGELLGFIGPNGSGKTTTIRLMLGIYAPAQGTVRVLGMDPVKSWSSLGPRVGVVLEQPGIDPHLNAREHLEYYGGLFQLPSAVVRKRSEELLRTFGLSDRASSPLGTFSKGMRQRVSLARCMLNTPSILILDEPFDGLDVESRRLIMDALPRLCREQRTSIFLTSHSLHDVEEISTRVAIIKRGEVVVVDAIDALRERVSNRRKVIVKVQHAYTDEDMARRVPDATYCSKDRQLTFDLSAGNIDQSDIVARLVKAGVSIESVSAFRPSLEDVYFAVTNESGATNDK